MSQRGGKRAGAGRKKGTSRKITRTAEIAEKAAAKGITPLEFILDIMRQPPSESDNPLVQIAHQEMRFEAAKAAAPYVHPKLQPVDGKGSSDLSVRHNLLVEFIGPAKK